MARLLLQVLPTVSAKWSQSGHELPGHELPQEVNRATSLFHPVWYRTALLCSNLYSVSLKSSLPLLRWAKFRSQEVTEPPSKEDKSCWRNGTLLANGFTACLGRWSGHIHGRMQ
jgi:hypothetical protein